MSSVIFAQLFCYTILHVWVWSNPLGGVVYQKWAWHIKKKNFPRTLHAIYLEPLSGTFWIRPCKGSLHVDRSRELSEVKLLS